MKKKNVLFVLLGLFLFNFSGSPQFSAYAFEEADVTFASYARTPSYITYKREYHLSTGFTATKFHRQTQNGRSYSGYLSFVQLSGKSYAIYSGRLYLEGLNGNIPVPAKFEPLN